MPRYKSTKTVPYSNEEMEYRGKLLYEVELAREERDDSHDEFDGQTYIQYYESNAKAARSFLPPKLNEEDTRIVSGVTEEKVNTMLSSALSYNFQPNLEAYDQSDDLVDRLGETMEDLVKKSREIEDYDLKRRIYYKEALDQGDCFVEEIWEQPVALTKKIVDDVYNTNKFLDYKWNNEIEVLRGEAKTNIIDGRNFFPGNIRVFDMDKQQMIVTREVISYDEAARLYGDWDRWGYVPEYFSPTTMNNEIGNVYTDYSMYEVNGKYVEIIKVQKRFTNEYQIFLNSVMMLPVGFPLSAINGVDEQGLAKYNISKLSVSPIGHNFFYSKSIPAKTKVKQGVKDELLKLMILKTQQSFKPPLANNTGTELSQHVLRPGFITDDVDINNLKPIINPTGVTTSEFNMYSMMQKEIDDVSTSSQFGGQADPNVSTATESLNLQQQNKIKLTSVLTGITLFEKKLTELRIDTILRNWTQPVDTRIDELKGSIDKVFRKVSIDSVNKKGDNVRRIIEFKEEMPDKYELYGKSDKMRKQLGKKVVMTVLDPLLLSLVKYYWKIIITPTPTENSALERELFINDVTVAQNIFESRGIKLNYEYLKKEYAKAMRLDADKFFVTDDLTDIMMTQVPEEQKQSGKKTTAAEEILKNPVGKQVSENMVPGGKVQPSTRELLNTKQ